MPEMDVILADVQLPAPLRTIVPQAPPETYVVGGAVRDLLLGRPVGDWDLVTPAPEAFAQAIAAAARARAVRLHSSPIVLRVVCPGLEIDVVEMSAGGLVADLSQRDFTINALAIALAPEELLVDPFGGMRDLRAGFLRAVDDYSLATDPVRLVRAYRLAAELSFSMASRTRALIHRDRALVESSPQQRIGREMLRLLNAVGPAALAVVQMERDGLLDMLLPCVAPMRSLGRGGFHHLDVLGHTLEALILADRLISAPRRVFSQAAHVFDAYLRRPDSRAALRAAVLFHDLGKPDTYRRTSDNRSLFYGHEELGAQRAEKILRDWGWPRSLRDTVAQLIDAHLRPSQLARGSLEQGQPVTDRALRHIQADMGEHLSALFLLAAADIQASRGPATSPVEQHIMLALLDEMMGRTERLNEIPARTRLVTGRDLMDTLGLPPGPELGRLLDAVEEAHEKGQIATRQDALDLARRLARQAQPRQTCDDNPRGK